MHRLLSVLLIMAIIVAIAIIVGKRLNRPKRIMQEGKLLKSEMVSRDGHTIVEQKWSYEDFCDVTVRLEDCTYALNRQVEVIALVRSFRPIPVDELDRIARPPSSLPASVIAMPVTMHSPQSGSSGYFP